MINGYYGKKMTLQEEAILSYYKEIAQISSHENVCLVQHIETKRIYVKKVLTEYKREIYEMLRRQKYPCFPRIYELLETEGTLILIEEYINGSSLEELLEEEGVFTEKESVQRILQICEEICLLHGQKPPVIHRDLKPSNIILTESGELKIIDFNTSRYYIEHASKDTVVLGTKEYAPPEQWGYGQTDARSDIYAIGIMFNVFLTGRFPEICLYEGIWKPVIQKCIQFDPKNRYQTIQELIQEIRALSQVENEDHTLWEEGIVKNTEQHEENTCEKKISEEGYISARTHSRKNKDHSEKELSDHMPGLRAWLPPGYRSGTWWKMILAAIGYLMVFWCSLTLEIKDATPYQLLVNRIGCLIMMLLCILFWFNYGNVHRILPLVKEKRIVWKIAGYMLYTLIIFVAVISVLVLIGG